MSKTWKVAKIRQWVIGESNPWRSEKPRGMRDTWCLVDDAGTPMETNSLNCQFSWWKTKKAAQACADRINAGAAAWEASKDCPEAPSRPGVAL